MATLSKPELISALTRLGRLAAEAGEHIELLLLGGGAMVLGFSARESTRDVDAVILSPADRAAVRRMIEVVGQERGWPADWMNDGAKGFLIDPQPGNTLLSVAGLTARIPIVEQLLAMKLGAWRDDVDISDARRLLSELRDTREEIWARVARHVAPGRELKAKMAFDDLWDEQHAAD
ncbi:hypothetical protein RAS1_39820 [Phycisphaerae bacterium RAS1]|nr:hypothetical protein RAS1_39820 [Phycisphaerae bacterium RAS1]